MRVFRTLEEARAGFAPSVVTVGNFDGVHAGHRALLRRTVALAREIGAQPSAVTFHPHPTAVVAPERTPPLLATVEERCGLMMREGIEQVFVMPFDRRVASMEPRAFFETVLVGALRARGVVVGDNFHFGRKQSGHVDTLQELGREAGVMIEVSRPVVWRGVMVSSSVVRRLLASGEVGKAGRLLERPYSLTGNVVKGEGRGARQTVPTLNVVVPSLDDATRALPLEGVYVTRTEDVDSARGGRSITNVGYRPTFGGTHLTVETFVLEGLEGPAPERIRVEFLRRLRAERKFASAAELKEQILRDVGRAQAWFRRMDRWVRRSATPAARR